MLRSVSFWHTPLAKASGLLLHRVATRRPPFESSAAVALSTGVNSGVPPPTFFPTFINPICRMLIAAFRSRSMERLQTLQWYILSDSLRSCLILPHFEALDHSLHNTFVIDKRSHSSPAWRHGAFCSNTRKAYIPFCFLPGGYGNESNLKMI